MPLTKEQSQHLQFLRNLLTMFEHRIHLHLAELEGIKLAGDRIAEEIKKLEALDA